MTLGFRRRHEHRIEVHLSDQEVTLLRQLFIEMLDLFDTGSTEEEQDPLARMVGISEHVDPPDDPVLQRLFPDAYADAESASDFRRYTQESLREQKRTAAEQVSSALGKGGEHLVLDPEEARTWLRALNDVRLALGTRLGVTEEAQRELAQMDPSDSRYSGYAAYDWLSLLVDSLVQAL